MGNEKKSPLQEAITDYKEIIEAAENNAKSKLSAEFPDKFQKLIKEEIDSKNNNKENKESYKKIDENKESNKDNIDSKENKNMKNESKEIKKKSIKEEDSKESKKESVNEEFDITDLDSAKTANALDNAADDDEVVTMDDIEKEIAEMEDLETELNSEENPTDLSDLKKSIEEMLNKVNKMSEMHNGKFDLNKMHNGTYDDSLIDEDDMDEMHNGKFDLKQMHDGKYDDSLIDEDDDEEEKSDINISDADIDAIVNMEPEDDDDEEMKSDDEDVDEAHGLAFSSRRHNPGRHLPGEDYLSQGEKDQAPYLKENESIKNKLNSLMEENKKLTKKVNESKKVNKNANVLIEKYKTALDKYRVQLTEMAVYNTNLAHVNNLLVNEELTLNQDDKLNIINKFKSVNNINESEKTYKNLLSEMKINKKSISENFEKKISGSISDSSKRKLDEVTEKTAYANNEHISKIKRLIETIEKKDNKKII